jgi:hypothetical protein
MTRLRAGLGCGFSGYPLRRKEADLHRIAGLVVLHTCANLMAYVSRVLIQALRNHTNNPIHLIITVWRIFVP